MIRRLSLLVGFFCFLFLPFIPHIWAAPLPEFTLDALPLFPSESAIPNLKLDDVIITAPSPTIPSPTPSPILPMPSPTKIPLNDEVAFLGDYFDNASVSGTPVLSRNDNQINYTWGNVSPGNNIPEAGYSVRWKKLDVFDGGTYRFHITASGGIKLFINNTNIFDKTSSDTQSYTVDTSILAGKQTVQVEYVPNTWASVIVNWEKVEQPTATPTFMGEYYANPSLSGLPSLVRNDPTIHFEWGEAAPDTNISADHFSVRWKTTQQFSGSTYRFTTTVSDGVKLIIDGIPYIDKWDNTQQATYITDVVLSGGPHVLEMDYSNTSNNALADLSWKVIGDLPTTDVKAEYFPNIELEGKPTITANYPAIAFDWGNGSPDPQIPVDQFSARFTKTENFAGGQYRFVVTADDGVRMFLDGHAILDEWHPQSPSTFTSFASIPSGTHTLVVEYFEEQGNAVIKVNWDRQDGPSEEIFDASYFTNANLTGQPTLTRKDSAINFDWKTGSPDPTIPNDNFSVRWLKSATFDSGTYQFTALSDDGIRVFVDGIAVIDQWHDHPASPFTADVPMAAGDHTIKVEYYEHTGTAQVNVSWKKE